MKLLCHAQLCIQTHFSDTSVEILAFGAQNITKNSLQCEKCCYILPGIYNALGFQQPLTTSFALVFPSGPLPAAATATAETSTLVHGTKLLSLLTGSYVIKQHQYCMLSVRMTTDH